MPEWLFSHRHLVQAAPELPRINGPIDTQVLNQLWRPILEKPHLGPSERVKRVQAGHAFEVDQDHLHALIETQIRQIDISVQY